MMAQKDVVSIRLRRETKDALSKAAKEDDRPRSYLIERAVIEWLERRAARDKRKKK